jgi:transcriptional regulator with XRE-family HTH domain
MPKNIGSKIRKIRELRNLTQEHVAEQLGFKSPRPYRKLETGEHSPTLYQLEKMSELFGCVVEDIRRFDPERFSAQKKHLAQPDSAKDERLEKIIEQQNGKIDALLGQFEKLSMLAREILNRAGGGAKMRNDFSFICNTQP